MTEVQLDPALIERALTERHAHRRLDAQPLERPQPIRTSAQAAVRAARRSKQHDQRTGAAVRPARLREGQHLLALHQPRAHLALSTGWRPGDPRPLPCTTRTQRQPRLPASIRKPASAPRARRRRFRPCRSIWPTVAPDAAAQLLQHIVADAGLAVGAGRRSPSATRGRARPDSATRITSASSSSLARGAARDAAGRSRQIARAQPHHRADAALEQLMLAPAAASGGMARAASSSARRRHRAAPAAPQPDHRANSPSSSSSQHPPLGKGHHRPRARRREVVEHPHVDHLQRRLQRLGGNSSPSTARPRRKGGCAPG